MATAWPVLLGALISQASPLIDQVFASFLSAGSISALNYSLKLMSVPAGVIFTSVGRALLPYLSRQVAINDMKAFKETLHLYWWVVCLVTTALSVFMIVLAHPLVQILFQRGAFSADDTNRTATTLIGFLFGLTPMASGFITSKAFSALGKTKVLVYFTLFSISANAIFDYIFAHFLQAEGIALATSVVYVCSMFFQFFVLNRMLGKLNLLSPPSQIVNVASKIFIWRTKSTSSASIFSGRLQAMIRIGIITAVFIVGITGTFLNSLYTLRIAFGSTIMLVFLRYRYILLIVWVLIDALIGSNLPIFNGNNFLTGLIVPTLLLMTCMPIQKTLKRMPALAFLLIYLAWVFAGIGISPLSVGAFLTVWITYLNCAAIVVLTINTLTTHRRMLGLIDAILISTTFVSLYGFYGYITKQNGFLDSTTSLFRIFSVFGSAPTLSLFLSIVIPLAFYRTFTLRGFKRVISLIVILIFLVALGLTLTRAAFICVPLSIIIMIFFLPSRKMRASLLTAILILAVPVSLLATVDNVPIFSRFFSQDITTLNGRTYLWKAILDNFDPTQVLGKGLNASSIVISNLNIGNGPGMVLNSPHDLFLGTLYDHGIIGIALLMLICIALVTSFIIGIRKTTGDHRTLFATVFAIFISVFVQSFQTSDFWVPGISPYFWIIMALPFALCWLTPKQISHTEMFDKATEPQIEAIQLAALRQVSHV